MALAVGVVLNALALAAINGIKAGTKALGNGLKAVGKKLGSFLPELGCEIVLRRHVDLHLAVKQVRDTLVGGRIKVDCRDRVGRRLV